MAQKRRWSSFVFHSFLLLPFIAIPITADSALRQDSAWKQYRNQHWGYCVSYPSRWMRGDVFEGAGILVEAGVKKHSRPVGEIDVEAIPDTAGSANQSSALLLIENVQSHLEGLKKFERAEELEVLEKREMQLVDNSALFTKDRFYDPQDHTKWVEEIVLAERKKALYRLELECRSDQLARFEPVFTHLVSTFQFECSPVR